jgi:hypothetical protein
LVSVKSIAVGVVPVEVVVPTGDEVMVVAPADFLGFTDLASALASLMSVFTGFVLDDAPVVLGVLDACFDGPWLFVEGPWLFDDGPCTVVVRGPPGLPFAYAGARARQTRATTPVEILTNRIQVPPPRERGKEGATDSTGIIHVTLSSSMD